MTNTLYTGDNLYIMNGMNSETVDLIYLDPPFNSKRIYSAPIGTKAAGASFKDMWTWEDVDQFYLETLIVTYPSLVKFIESIGQSHGKPMMAYVTYMTQRLIELHRILKSNGSIYLHVDPTASHYLKIIMDTIFGKKNFRNEIVWCYTSGGVSKKWFSKKHDIILFYSKSSDYQYNPQYRPYSDGTLNRGLTQYKKNMNENYELRKEGALLQDWWADITPLLSPTMKERTGYPTQKPLSLLHRIIKTSSHEGNVVFDPFCGCATACVAAQQLNRKWIGIDIEAKAAEVLVERLSDDAGFFKDFIHRIDVPVRTDIKIEPITLSVKQNLFNDQNGYCNGCHDKFDIRHLEIDHIVPKSRGGGDYYQNYQLLCGNCNKSKGNRPMEYLRMKISKRQELLAQRVTFGM